MNIYTPSEYSSIKHDLEYVLAQIGDLYDVRFQSTNIECTSIMLLPQGTYWASQASHDHFNALVPRIKMLHMGMYSILEAVAKNELGQRSVKDALEPLDPLFTTFRELNNQFKHFDKKSVDIQLFSVGYLDGMRGGRIEPMYRVSNINFPYSRFIVMFLNMLEKTGAISLHDLAAEG